ncbi:hypothetical protein JOB18_043302 [Solea senegalensis]|uniref:Uncharacterized protein n=2 Tax=Solea senegalensis TaxID=28829 RepID=A0AAV6SHT3_SOLSE|nr:hypothetical protein JOB18_043302 [Solea senegalensis]
MLSVFIEPLAPIGSVADHVVWQSRAFQEPVRKKKNKTNPIELRQRVDSIEKWALLPPTREHTEVPGEERRVRGLSLIPTAQREPQQTRPDRVTPLGLDRRPRGSPRWSSKLCLAMPQPSVSGMEPPFGDAFQNYSFADQALTSTELLATSSDPDFMYELDRDMSHRQSPCGDSVVGAGDGGKEVEGSMDQLMGFGETETVCSSSAFEQWDSYWEDLTRYTRLASCDIWGTKEVDFLGLDDFSSPYQDEEVISRTPTLAQLNSEDSQPVCETLYPPAADLTLPTPQLQTQPSQFPWHSKRALHPGQGSGPGSARPSQSSTSGSRPSRSLLPDFPEGSQKATRPVPSSTETVAKNQNHLSLTQNHSQAQSKTPVRGTKMLAPSSHGSDFVRKAKVRVSAVQKAQPNLPIQPDPKSVPPLPLSQPQDEKASTSACATLVGFPGAAAGGSGTLTSFERRAEGTGRREMPVGWSSSVPQLVETNQALEGSTSGLVSSGETVAGASSSSSPGVLVVEGAVEKSKEEEHNYSLFLTRSQQAGRTHAQLDEDEEEEDEEEADEEEEADGLELDDEDHDEGFGSEHELSENEEEEEEEEEDDDYEADKDDDMSDAFSEPGCDMELMEDIKGLTAGVSTRKRGKRRYFWEYSEQLTPSKQERMLKPSEWDRHTLPSNLYQKNGPLHVHVEKVASHRCGRPDSQSAKVAADRHRAPQTEQGDQRLDAGERAAADCTAALPQGEEQAGIQSLSFEKESPV